jgi:hypothetical protein
MCVIIAGGAESWGAGPNYVMKSCHLPMFDNMRVDTYLIK